MVGLQTTRENDWAEFEINFEQVWSSGTKRKSLAGMIRQSRDAEEDAAGC